MKKSFYIFLSALLGFFLFFILHRILVFIYLYLVATGYLTSSFVWWRFLLVDYFTLSLTLMAGIWYGIWLGFYWYEKVYEQGTHTGLVGHLVKHYWPTTKPKNLNVKISNIREKLEKDLSQLESLAKAAEVSVEKPKPIVRRVVRKRAPKKLNSLK